MKWWSSLIATLLFVTALATSVVAETESAYEGMSAETVEQIHNNAEKHQFKTEVDRMMKLIINSLYKNKEIFLRELISNASDALDKIRFLSLTNPSMLNGAEHLKVEIRADPENKLLHIRDYGVGMTKEHLEKNLGTIAKSGTAEFLQSAENADNVDLIGQFGVGFYSAFLVADTVTVVSKSNDDEQYIWESDASSNFIIMKDPRGNTLGRGTQITLHIKEDAEDFLEEKTLKDLVEKYSEFITFPIYLWSTNTIETEVPLEEGDEGFEDVDSGETGDDEDLEVADGEEAPKTKVVSETVSEYQQVNTVQPIWTRSIESIDEEEYNEFYKSFTKDRVDPMAHLHFKAEGEVEFRSILYVPSKAPENLYTSAETINNIKLFVRRVFITDEGLDLLPKYLQFVTGIVDSDDLPLNVSRETLQQHKMLKVIKKKITRKVLELIKSLTDDKEKYNAFYKQYSNSLKMGVLEDNTNRKKIAQLLRFSSSHGDEKISLEAYVERMKKNQKDIYFMSGTTMTEIKNSPFVERLLAKGYEVLYLPDPVDEYVLQTMMEFEGHKFQNVAKEGLQFSDEGESDQEKMEDLKEEFQPLTSWMKTILKEVVDKVVISNRLTTSPAALVASQFGLSGNMERIMRAQAYANSEDPMSQFQFNQKKTMEINPKHPVIASLLKKVEYEEQDQSTEELVMILYDTAALRSGYTFENSVDFAKRIENILRINLGVDMNEEVVVDEVIAEDKVDDEDDEDESEEEDEPVHDEL